MLRLHRLTNKPDPLLVMPPARALIPHDDLSSDRVERRHLRHDLALPDKSADEIHHGRAISQRSGERGRAARRGGDIVEGAWLVLSALLLFLVRGDAADETSCGGVYPGCGADITVDGAAVDEGFGLGEGAGGDVGLGDVELDAEVGFVVVEGEEVGGGVFDVVAD